MSQEDLAGEARRWDTTEADNARGPQRSEEADDGDVLPNRPALNPQAVQAACREVIRHLYSNPVLAQNAWGSALTTAPSAIAIMAMCLKLSSEEQAAGIKVESMAVMDYRTNLPAGFLPSPYLYTNLQYCSDIGRLAFLEAQNRMSHLNSVARNMIGEVGSIGYIVELLEYPEDAEHDLKPEIARIDAAAKDCLKSAEVVSERFWYWYLVIQHLKTSVQTLRGRKSDEKEKMAKIRDIATELQEKYTLSKDAAENGVTRTRNQLSRAQSSVDEAGGEVKRLQSHQPSGGSLASDDVKMAEKAFPQIKAPKGKRVIARWIVNKQRCKYITEAGASRLQEQNLAMEKLNEARDKERERAEELDIAWDKYVKEKSRLLQAKADLGRIGRELDRLGNQKMELDDIIRVLETSTEELGRLKAHLDQLVDFFQAILRHVKETSETHLKSFLEPIKRQRGRGGRAGVSMVAKKKFLSAALRMQGQFSAVADISSAYVQVSAEYIRPAINRMEMLSGIRTNDTEWPRRRDEFMQWCEEAAGSIAQLVEERREAMHTNLESQITTLQQRGTEAAATDDDEE